MAEEKPAEEANDAATDEPVELTALEEVIEKYCASPTFANPSHQNALRNIPARVANVEEQREAAKKPAKKAKK